jgi:hypothetical protein
VRRKRQLCLPESGQIATLLRQGLEPPEPSVSALLPQAVQTLAGN